MIRAIERRFSAIANRPALALAVVGSVALLTSALPYLYYSRSLVPFSSWSFFSAYDEFSYLLAADTFASGRLTNPTHPMRRHFETRSVNHVPTYHSIYPPGQGAFLAMGRVLTGHPIVGVWISMALASMATCYLLQAWFPPRWSLLGALLAALHARMALDWGGTYWGGAVAMLGGALVFGGLRRILDRGWISDSLLFALGLALLANSRPFEGLVASLPAVLVLAGWLRFDKRLPRGIRFARIAVPILALLAVTAAGMGYYNHRLTGSPWTLPYQIYLEGHPDETPFASTMAHGEPPDENHSGEPAGRDDSREGETASPYHEWWIEAYMRLLTSSSPVVAAAFKLAIQWAFYLGPLLSVALIALPFGRWNRWTWFAASTVGVTVLAVLTTNAGLPHYLAPAAPLIFVLVVEGSRSLGPWRRRGGRIGRRWVPVLSVLWLLQLLFVAVVFPTAMRALRWGEPRARLRARLERMDGEHLVIVRYGPSHVFYQEWVYNEADIDRARVVWARELAPDSNRELLAYFQGRRVWLVEPDRNPEALVPYELPTPEAMSHAAGTPLGLSSRARRAPPERSNSRSSPPPNPRSARRGS